MTEAWDCAEARVSLGVYVLGAIDPAERALVDAHLATCRDCRDELAGLAGIPALLARVSPEELERISGDAPRLEEPAPPELIDTVIDLAAARRRRSRWRYAGAAAAAAALAGGIFGGLAASRSPAPLAPAAASIPFGPGKTNWDQATGTNPTGEGVTVTYAPEKWGEVLAAKTWGIPVGTNCQLWVVHKDGSRTMVTQWTTAADEGTVGYPGGMSMPDTAKGIKSFQVTEGSKLLVSAEADPED
ncbi:MAG: zf-HC2 domain-containing protein [Streptosporangiaceae bacterium]|nr:zf-HC2 domain-containing protein [Streptosporangiaceae bacterium]